MGELEGWFGHFSPKSIILTFLFSLFKPIGRKEKGLTSEISPPFPDSSSLSTVHLLQVMFCWNFRTSSFLLALRCVFLSFSLAFHAWMKDYCCKLLKAVRVLFCHEFMFNWHGISRGKNCFLVYMKEVRSAENSSKKESLEKMRLWRKEPSGREEKSAENFSFSSLLIGLYKEKKEKSKILIDQGGKLH